MKKICFIGNGAQIKKKKRNTNFCNRNDGFCEGKDSASVVPTSQQNIAAPILDIRFFRYRCEKVFRFSAKL